MSDEISRDMRFREFQVMKDAVPCAIRTKTSLIEGRLHKRAAFRIIDELNQGEEFIAVTQAVIRDGLSNNPIKAPFLSLRKDQIVWVIPNEKETINLDED